MTTEMARAIRESVQSGEYASTSEALRDAVRMWQRRRAKGTERLHAIRARIRRSLDDPRRDLDEHELDGRLKAFGSAKP